MEQIARLLANVAAAYATGGRWYSDQHDLAAIHHISSVAPQRACMQHVQRPLYKLHGHVDMRF